MTYTQGSIEQCLRLGVATPLACRQLPKAATKYAFSKFASCCFLLVLNANFKYWFYCPKPLVLTPFLNVMYPGIRIKQDAQSLLAGVVKLQS